MRHRVAIVLGVTLLVSACAPIPTGPSVMVVAGHGKNWEQFRADERQCREAAADELRTTKSGTVPAQQRYDMVYVQCMYAHGNEIAAPAPAGPTASSEAVPPGTPMGAPAAWPPTPAQIDCERSGGVWRTALNFCEYPAPEFPIRRWR